MQLEMGLIPVKYVNIQKLMKFLYYILHENKYSIIHQVYVARSRDFKALTDKVGKELDRKYSDEYIEVFGKVALKKYIKEKVIVAAFNFLVAENSTKEKN